MASTVKKGSSGSDVKSLQTALNSKGYSLDVDGVFGSKTESALRDYQAKNALTADGIAGAKTWASLNGSSSSSSSKKTKKTASAPAEPRTAVTALGTEYDPGKTTAAAADLAAAEARTPASYESPYAARTEELLSGLGSREPFAYDLSADPLYRQYRREYLSNASRAMEDARGAAAANTGGYGSSYAESAAQQAFDNYLSGLNDLVPQLYDRARSSHDTVYEDALKELEALQSADKDAYARYSADYDRYMDWLNYQYGKLTDEQAQKNWEKEYKKKYR